MAQSVPSPISSDAPRPLPRRERVPSPKTNRPRFLLLDGAWIAGLTLLSIIIAGLAHGFAALRVGGALVSAGTVCLAYLLGWRARDRATAIIAALLLATSLPFTQIATSLPLTMQETANGATALFCLLSLAALFAFVAGSSLAALTLAACATLARPEGLLLGLLLLGLSFAQHRKRALIGAAVFLLPVLAGGAALALFGHQHLSPPALHPHGGLLVWLTSPGIVFLLWFLLPFCGELGDSVRRARWLPVVCWTVLYLAAESLLRTATGAAMLLPLLAPLFILTAGGLSRLLPILSGEFPSPIFRYVLATLAVLSLVGLRAWFEWPQPFK